MSFSRPPVSNDPPLYKISTGRPAAFNSPDELWQAAVAYFEWAENNPLWESKLVSFQGVSTVEYFPKLRALTLNGLYLHAGICEQTWYNYKAKPLFLGVCNKIESAIREQKFSGAAADLLNPAIIARDLGLADKQEITGKDGGAIRMESITASVTPQEAADAYQRMINGDR